MRRHAEHHVAIASDATVSLSQTLPVVTREAPPPELLPELDERALLVLEDCGLTLRGRDTRLAGPELALRGAPVPDALELPCLFCGGTLHHRSVPVRLSRRGTVLSLKGLEAWVCRRCEQPYFEPREVYRARRALRKASRRRAP